MPVVSGWGRNTWGSGAWGRDAYTDTVTETVVITDTSRASYVSLVHTIVSVLSISDTVTGVRIPQPYVRPPAASNAWSSANTASGLWAASTSSINSWTRV